MLDVRLPAVQLGVADEPGLLQDWSIPETPDTSCMAQYSYTPPQFTTIELVLAATLVATETAVNSPPEPAEVATSVKVFHGVEVAVQVPAPLLAATKTSMLCPADTLVVKLVVTGPLPSTLNCAFTSTWFAVLLDCTVADPPTFAPPPSTALMRECFEDRRRRSYVNVSSNFQTRPVGILICGHN